MAETKKVKWTFTDNKFLATKLHLRRTFLEAYHPTPPRVLDCCQGSGKIWNALRKQYPVAFYWGLDKKPKKGRWAVDSVRVLESGKWQADVVDIDTYGSPWAHWMALLATGHGEVTVFLTVGFVRVGGLGFMSDIQKKASGIGGLSAKVPPAILSRLHDYSIEFTIRQALLQGWEILDCAEAFPSTSARYFGLRLRRIALIVPPESAIQTPK